MSFIIHSSISSSVRRINKQRRRDKKLQELKRQQKEWSLKHGLGSLLLREDLNKKEEKKPFVKVVISEEEKARRKAEDSRRLYECLGGGVTKQTGHKTGVLAQLYKEPNEKVREEILRKSMMVAPAYNKGPLMFITPDTQKDTKSLSTLGNKK